MKTLNEIETLLSEKLAENQAEIKEFTDNILKAEQTIEQANKALLEAEEAADVDQYNKAKNDIWSAQHAKELYQKKLDEAKSKRLVSKEEYEAITQAILKIANDDNQSQLEEASELIADIKTIAIQSSNMFKQASNLLSTLQSQVFKTDGIEKKANGGILVTLLPTVNLKYTVNDFYQSRVKGSPLSQMVGEENEKKRNISWY
ncbi:hypothetical protein [Vagococcus xieshaowenii]|uniref:Uncharacterized protein n=1 Tax=Vagococcus xieshaowenii TaxID=2562451 RepID=A0AAJ5EFE6_9ENTE|nr:hypothetical protein [Vagococcus xieshaowenii]QCA29159.1 hypothetical protein E4Z98_07465 [Vagococcus xieshaowenii]TFZ40863.1 hypothetical protein E4031_05625 [Vagococcus xieshaowenii]